MPPCLSVCLPLPLSIRRLRQVGESRKQRNGVRPPPTASVRPSKRAGERASSDLGTFLVTAPFPFREFPEQPPPLLLSSPSPPASLKRVCPTQMLLRDCSRTGCRCASVDFGNMSLNPSCLVKLYVGDDDLQHHLCSLLCSPLPRELTWLLLMAAVAALPSQLSISLVIMPDAY